MSTDEYNAIYRELYGWLYKRIAPDDIEDVIQHVFMKWWIHRHEVEQMKSYIFQSARHRCVDLYRKRDRDQWLSPWENDYVDEGIEEQVLSTVVCDKVLSTLRKQCTDKEKALIEELISSPSPPVGSKISVDSGVLTSFARENGENVNTVKTRKYRIQGKAKQLRHMLEDVTV